MGKIIRLTESDLHNIVKRCIRESLDNQTEAYINNVCMKLNQLANTKEGVNIIDKNGLPERHYNYRPYNVDEDYYITFDIIDSDNEKYDDTVNITDYDSYNEETESYSCDMNVINNFFQSESKGLKGGIKFALAHQKMVIPPTVQKKLDKLNAEINSAIQEYGMDDIMMESGDESGFVAKNFRFEINGDDVQLLYDTDKGVEDSPTTYGPWFYKMLDIYDFNDDEFKDAIKWYRACLKRGLRYMREYNPEWDDDEEAKERFLNGGE